MSYFNRTILQAQVPYDEVLGETQLELEGNDGQKTRLPLRIEETAPTLADPNVVYPEVRPGDPLTLRLTGCGRFTELAPAGQLPPDGLKPVASIEVFVGGRPARILSIEPSRTEVGEVEVTAEVPALAPEVHQVSYRVARGPVREARAVLLK